MSFPLLRLPIIAALEVCKNMEIGERIFLICVQTSQATPQMLRAKESDLVEHFADVFKKPKVELRIEYCNCPLHVLKLFKDLQLPIESVYYNPDGDSQEVSAAVLNECKAIRKLFVADIKDFQHSSATPDLHRNDEFRVHRGTAWVKLENFTECQKIRLQNVDNTQGNASPAYLNSFFKKLMDADCRLKSVSMEFEAPFSFQGIVQELGVIQRQGNDRFVEALGKYGKQIRITEKHSHLKNELIVQVI